MTGTDVTRGSQAGLWLILLVTIAVQVLATFTTLSLAAIAPDVASGIGVSPELVGFQVSLIYLGAAVMSTVAGFQLRRWGPIRVSQASLIFCTVGAALAIVPSVPVIALGSLIIGFGYGMTNPAASELLLRLMPPERRNLIFSIKQTGVPIGGVLAGLTAPTISQSFGWQWAPAVAAISCFVLVLLMQPMRATWDAERDPTARFSERPFDAMTIVWAVAAAALAVGQRLLLCRGSTFASHVCGDTAGHRCRFRLDRSGRGTRCSSSSRRRRAGCPGLVADRIGKGLIVLVIMGAASITGALLVMAVSEAWGTFAIFALFTLFGVNALGWTGVYQVEAARYAPQGKLGTVIGGITAPTYGGVIMGSAVFSIAFVAVGSYTTTFALVALFAVLGMLSLALVGRAAARDPIVSS